MGWQEDARQCVLGGWLTALVCHSGSTSLSVTRSWALWPWTRSVQLPLKVQFAHLQDSTGSMTGYLAVLSVAGGVQNARPFAPCNSELWTLYMPNDWKMVNLNLDRGVFKNASLSVYKKGLRQILKSSCRSPASRPQNCQNPASLLSDPPPSSPKWLPPHSHKQSERYEGL